MLPSVAGGTGLESLLPTDGPGLLPDGPWLDRLNLAFVRATCPAVAATFAAAADWFRHSGFAALAPLDDGLEFDAVYFRETNPAWEGASDRDCYREWLMDGIARGQHPSAKVHLQALGLALPDYPEGFPWQYYARLCPHAGGHRWAALDDFCETGFAELGGALALGPNAATLLWALGRRFSDRDDTLAIRAYELAQSLGPLPTVELQHLADAYLRLRLWRPALQHYTALLQADAGNGWTVRNMVTCAAALEAWQELFGLLDRARARHGQDELWHEAVDAAFRELFEARLRRSRGLMACGAEAAAELLLAKTVQDGGPVLDYLEGADRQPARQHRPCKILFLANVDDAESAARAVHGKMRALATLGIASEMQPFDAAAGLLPALRQFGALVLFRVPALAPVVRLVLAARRFGITCFYDSDTDLPDSDAAPTLQSFRGKVARGLYEDLRIGIALHRAAAALCEHGIAPTERLAESLRALTRQRRCAVVPNAWVPEPPPWRPRPAAGTGRLRIALRARSLTFLDAVPGQFGAAVLALLADRNDVEVLIAGPVHLDQRFDAHTDRIRRVDSGDKLWDDLATADVAVALPCDCAESEYRASLTWADAAALGMPAIITAPANWLPEIRHGRNAVRVEHLADWRGAADRLLRDAVSRARLSQRAAADAAARQGPAAAARALGRLFNDMTAMPGTHAAAG